MHFWRKYHCLDPLHEPFPTIHQVNQPGTPINHKLQASHVDFDCG